MSYNIVRRKRKQNEMYCGHCDEMLCKSAYWKHRKAYFNKTTHEWTTKEFLEQEQCKHQKIHDQDLWSCSSSDESEPRSSTNEADHHESSDVASEADEQIIQENDDSEEISSENSSSSDDRDSGPSESEDEPEIWSDSNEDLFEDMENNDTPLPEPRRNPSKCLQFTSLLRWFVYFLLFWQTTCKISDNGLEWLLRFVFQFLHSLGVTCNNEHLIEIAMMFPSSLYLLRQFVKLDRDNFTKYLVCPECCKLYHLDRCTVRIGDRIEARTCTNKAFPSGRKKECGAVLAKKVITGNNQTVFYPFKLYCVNSVINQIESILKRPGMPDLCEKWKRRQIQPGVMADIYDGQIWKDFKTYGGKDFLNAKRNLALGINVDWFQPYKRRNDRSVGVIYFVILNLPREERYKWENVVVAGIIPEMKKEPKSLNSFLDPIIVELKALWKGVRLQTSTSNIPLLHRAAVLLASSDIPASRKLCGFKGHSSHRGCSKCFKFFPSSFSVKTDYSGFDVENWPPRDCRTHRLNANKVKNAPNKTKHEALAKKHGVYYSSLLELDYFNAIRFTAIDPMHNLFLGTARHIFKLWVAEDLLSKKTLLEIEKRILHFDVPTGFGRLPNKIASNYGCYTASQWKHWTLIYSMYCLNGLLPEAHLRCWQTFVLACQYMSRHIISEVDITRAGGLFVKFGKQFQEVFGKDKVTPNIHLHCHLKECVLDYGPIHAFWCFSFERFNGILGATPMNGRSIEVQLMRKLIVGRFVWNTTMPSEFQETFLPFFKHIDSDDNSGFSAINAMYFSECASCHNHKDVNWNDLTLVTLPKSYQYMTLDVDDLHLLLIFYKQLLPDVDNLTINSLSSIARKYAYCFLGSEKFGSKKDSKSLRSSRIIASWANDDGSINTSSFARPGQVKFYILHSLTIDGNTRQFALACVSWHKKDEEADVYGKPTQVWRCKEFDNPGPAVFMPVQRILSTFASCSIERNGIVKIVISAIPRLFN